MRRNVVFIHGVATTSRVWRNVTPYFSDFDVVCPDRPASGDLDTEVAALAEICNGAIVVGVSGGATLGLELASRGVPVLAGVFHEPAAGSLAPGLLDHVRIGLRDAGVRGFGEALYGPGWTLDETPEDVRVVPGEFAMFSHFEPAPIGDQSGPILLTVGQQSPSARVASVQALSGRLGLPWASVPGGAHAVHLDAPRQFSELILEHIRQNLG